MKFCIIIKLSYANLHDSTKSASDKLGAIQFLYYEKLYSKPRRQLEFNRVSDFINVPRLMGEKLSPMKKQDSNLNWFSKIDKNLDLSFSVGYDFFNNYFVLEF